MWEADFPRIATIPTIPCKPIIVTVLHVKFESKSERYRFFIIDTVVTSIMLYASIFCLCILCTWCKIKETVEKNHSFFNKDLGGKPNKVIKTNQEQATWISW